MVGDDSNPLIWRYNFDIEMERWQHEVQVHCF